MVDLNDKDYVKKMKERAKKYKENPDSLTIEEINELTVFYCERIGEASKTYAQMEIGLLTANEEIKSSMLMVVKTLCKELYAVVNDERGAAPCSKLRN